MLREAKEYRVVVNDLDLERPIWVGGSGREEADIDLFFEMLGEEKSAAIELATMDIWEPFRNSVSKSAPQARIIYNRFYINRRLFEALDEVRREEHEHIASEQGSYVPGQFYTLLSHRENLDLDGSQALERRLDINQRLHTAHILKETFSQLWDYQSEPDALAFVENWKAGVQAQGLEPLLEFAALIDAHWEGIGSHYHPGNKISQGVVEKINNRIRTFQRRKGDEREEEFFKLKIITAFLPPLPEDADADRRVSAGRDGGARSLQSWFELLCQMLPNVRRGIVTEVGRGACLATPACWPPDAEPGEELRQLTTEVIKQEAPLAEGQMFGQPLRREGRLFAVAAIELDVGEEQQGVVQHLLDWGEQWLRLLLDAGPGTGDSRLEAANSQAGIMPLLEEALQAEQLQAAVLAVINRLASQFDCERVTLGLVRGKRMRVQGMSHGSQFDPRTSLIQGIEAVMQAVRESASMALWPSTGGPALEALEQLSENQGPRAACAVPLIGRQAVSAVILCERSEEAEFSVAEQETLAAAGRLLGPVLELKQEQSGNLSRRASQALGHSLDRVLKPGHRGFKLGLAAALAVITVLVLGQGSYRVSSEATIEGLIQRAIVAPFDGYIAEATVRAGDTVAKGELIARLDDRELLLELRKSTSEEAKLDNEYRKALADLDRSEAAIVQARLAQVQAQSRLVQQKLDRVLLTAPLAGIVISGDLSRSEGAPVERGQVLFEVAPLDEYRLVLNIEEQDIANIEVGQQGLLTLTSLPQERWRFVIEQVSPVFQELDGQVSFRTEARIEGGSQALRPGMEGVGKIEIGDRSFGWILFHDLLDWLRLQLWLWLP